MFLIVLCVCLWLLVCVVVLLFLFVFVLVQCVVEGDLQQQMLFFEFKVVGLDKFSVGELVMFNCWLQGKVEVVIIQVVVVVCEEGCQEVIKKNRGFLDFGSSELIESNLQGEFCGFDQGCCYVLQNGQEWEQIDVMYYFGGCKDVLGVSMCLGVMGVWYMKVDGVNVQLKVCCIK